MLIITDVKGENDSNQFVYIEAEAIVLLFIF